MVTGYGCSKASSNDYSRAVCGFFFYFILLVSLNRRSLLLSIDFYELIGKNIRSLPYVPFYSLHSTLFIFYFIDF